MPLSDDTRARLTVALGEELAGEELDAATVQYSDDIICASMDLQGTHTAYCVLGVQVVGEQGAPITNPDTTGGQLQTAVIAILDRLRAHGLIDT